MSEISALQAKKVHYTLYQDTSLALKNCYIEIENSILQNEIATPQKESSHKQKLDIFERYLKCCGNDGHRYEESYYDSAKTKLMTRCVVNKKGQKDGPCFFYDDDGKSFSFGWYRKDKSFGKWIHESPGKYITHSETIYNKREERITPFSTIHDGKESRFFDVKGSDYLHYTLKDGRPDDNHKIEMRKRIEQMQKEGKSGVVLVDERLAAARSKIHKSEQTNKGVTDKQPTTIESETKETVSTPKKSLFKVMINAFKKRIR